MVKCEKNDKSPAAPGAPPLPSKDMPPLPQNFGPVFFKNQFRTTIDLPTRSAYPDVEGKCAIITGSNTGLGFEAARQLLSLGLSHLVMGVRSLEKGKEAAAKLAAAGPSAKIEVWQLDMDSYASIQEFTQKCHSTLPRADIAILNSGTGPLTFRTNPHTGHETTIQVNHISTALLACLLLPVLKSKSVGSNPPHLTIVNSVTAHLCKFPNRDQRPLLASFDDTMITKWDPQERYGVSKLVNQLFMVKLAENVSPDDVIINMVDPGLTKGTSLFRETTGLTHVFASMFFSVAGRTVGAGAATYIAAVLRHGRESHGCFLMNAEIAPLAHWYYSDGEALTNAIWAETLEELRFAGVAQIIKEIGPVSQ